METFSLLFFLIILTVIISFTKLSFQFFFPSNKTKPKLLPPGPPSIPFFGNLLWLHNFPSLPTIQTLLKPLHSHLGPIITLHFGPRPSIFISNPSLSHKALITLSPLFSSRPPPPPGPNSAPLNISFSPQNPLWRLLRRNLTSHILHPSKLHLFSHHRRSILNLLLLRLRSSSHPVVPAKLLRSAMFGLLARICFGENLSEAAMAEIEIAQRELVLYSNSSFIILPFVPKFLSGFLFRDRFRTLGRLRQRQSQLFIPLIRAREKDLIPSYAGSLLGIAVPEEGGRRLDDRELVSLCSEFLIAGADTTASALEWIMAEVVARPAVRAKLVEEVRAGEEIGDEDLRGMRYLKAVVMEGLRRHPPVHFVLPHCVAEDTVFEGYLIPKNVPVNFVVSEIGWDERVWENPMEFVPERFLEGGEGERVDITGRNEIKMMPFGVGTRMCPGFGIAMFHLEYFVANLVREFEWEAVDGEEIDFSEKFEFSTMMKKPFRARITPRRKNC